MDSMLMQESRKARLKTPLGDNALVITRFDGQEGVSELFEYRIEAYSKDEVNYDFILGVPARSQSRSTARSAISTGLQLKRSGSVCCMSCTRIALFCAHGCGSARAPATAVFFLDKKAPDIIEEVFRDRRFNDFRLSLSENHPKREYCVQYRETDFAFVSRLMEHEGIFYYFEHTANKHTLVLADTMSTLKPVPDFANIPFIAPGNVESRGRQHIYNVVSQRRFRTGKVELNEYNELQPNADQKANKTGTARYERPQMEFYDYPGKYKQRNEGEQYAKVVLEAEQALDGRRHTSGNAVCLFPGGLTTLQDHPKQSENIDYLVVRASHQYVAEQYRSGFSLQEEQEYVASSLDAEQRQQGIPRTDRDAQTADPRYPDRQGRRSEGRRDRRRRTWPASRSTFFGSKKKQSCRRFASLRCGPENGAGSSFRALAWRSLSNSSKAIRIGRWWWVPSTTANTSTDIEHAERQDPIRRQIRQHQGQRRLQRASVRGQEVRREDHRTRPEGLRPHNSRHRDP